MEIGETNLKSILCWGTLHTSFSFSKYFPETEKRKMGIKRLMFALGLYVGSMVPMIVCICGHGQAYFILLGPDQISSGCILILQGETITHHQYPPVAVPVDPPKLDIGLCSHSGCSRCPVDEGEFPKAASLANAGGPLIVHIDLPRAKRICLNWQCLMGPNYQKVSRRATKLPLHQKLNQLLISL